MKQKTETYRLLLAVFCGVVTAVSCGGEKKPVEIYSGVNTAGGISGIEKPDDDDDDDIEKALISLEEFAELERSGSYIQGMGLTESMLRENAGDYAGAILSAFKELSRAYGRGAIQKSDLEHGLENVLSNENSRQEMVQTARGIRAFVHDRWDEAELNLRPLFDGKEAPDDFSNWMILTCVLEKQRAGNAVADAAARQTAAAYRAIRARYMQFPEYWYRGARNFSGLIAGEYAEQCINLAPAGPFAAECRNILAECAGLRREDGASLKSKLEIESIISRSVNDGKPENLAPLIPLISLPENPYTVYALGALRALSAAPKFREYFNVLAGSSRGRLAERLAYISRG